GRFCRLPREKAFGISSPPLKRSPTFHRTGAGHWDRRSIPNIKPPANIQDEGSSTMNTELLIILLCGVLALLYGGWTIRSVLSMSAGNARMQEIAAGIQEGARASFNR